MSYDIDLICPDDADERRDAGHYSDRLARYWRDALGRPLGELHGTRGLVAAPLLAQAARHLLAAGNGYEGQSFEGEYEEATLALVQLWAVCRECPDHVLSISY
jgi:hypothetical protein